MRAVVIEDSPEIVESITLCLGLRWAGAEVVSADNGCLGIDHVKQRPPDVVVLDIGLPDIDGFEVCRRIRRFSDVPIVIVTARGDDLAVAKGLELGADDYIVKPFSHVELLARIKVVLRRCLKSPFEETREPLSMGRLWIDFAAREVRIDNREVRLTPIEYDLLQSLAANAGHVIPHQVLLEKVWGDEYTDCTEYLKVYTQRLRAKLGDDRPDARVIVCERGVGYMLRKDGIPLN